MTDPLADLRAQAAGPDWRRNHTLSHTRHITSLLDRSKSEVQRLLDAVRDELAWLDTFHWPLTEYLPYAWELRDCAIALRVVLTEMERGAA